jgi:hypothetical protein
MIDALLLVPLIMAAFFYPIQALVVGVAAVVVTLVGWEGYVIWKRRQQRI